MSKSALKYFLLNVIIDNFFDRLIKEFNNAKISFDDGISMVLKEFDILKTSVLYDGIVYSTITDIDFLENVQVEEDEEDLLEYLSMYITEDLVSKEYYLVEMTNDSEYKTIEQKIKFRLFHMCKTNPRLKTLLQVV